MMRLISYYVSALRPGGIRFGEPSGGLLMKFLLCTLTAATLVACASAGSNTVTREAPESVEGTYEFFASIPGNHMRGTLRILADTMLVEAKEAGCVYAAGLPNRQGDQNVFRYGCTGGVLLSFDRRNPTQFSKWSASITVQRRREVCVETAVQGGREICVRKGMEPYEDIESRTGIVQLRRATP